MSEVVVLDYDPEWPRMFERLRSAVWPAVADIAVAIEHVGSTSVPGLAAKPVIDLDVIVAEADVETGIARLEGLGYAHRGDLGIAGREAFASPPGTPRHHLYVCKAGGPALANHLAVRDHLRSNAAAAAAYATLKKRLAREFPDDIGGYIEAKTGFLSGILRKAGFDEATIAGIERSNTKTDPDAGPDRS